jgi:hypothetical protein
MFHMTYLLDGAVIVLNLPVLVMQPEEGFPVNGGQLSAVR